MKLFQGEAFFEPAQLPFRATVRWLGVLPTTPIHKPLYAADRRKAARHKKAESNGANKTAALAMPTKYNIETRGKGAFRRPPRPDIKED